MTARWSGAGQRRVKWQHFSPKPRLGLPKSNADGFPTALGGWSLKGMSTTGARNVNVGCRNGVEAS